MTKEELAQQYADEKTKAFAEAIKDAYLKGYEQGELYVASTINIDGVDYVDLGLPSGTLWAAPKSKLNGFCSSYEMYSFVEANKVNIPIVEQFEELKKNCRTVNHPRPASKQVDIVGLYGQRIEVCTCNYDNPYNGFTNHNDYQGEGADTWASDKHSENIFGLKSSVEDGKAKAFKIDDDGDWRVCKHFAGFKLPLFLVKSKQEI